MPTVAFFSLLYGELAAVALLLVAMWMCFKPRKSADGERDDGKRSG